MELQMQNHSIFLRLLPWREASASFGGRPQPDAAYIPDKQSAF